MEVTPAKSWYMKLENALILTAALGDRNKEKDYVPRFARIDRRQRAMLASENGKGNGLRRRNVLLIGKADM